MDSALVLFINILIMLLYSLPGFVLVKLKMLKESAIEGFNVLLLYVAQPCLAYYALTKVPFETRILFNMLYTFAVSLGVMLLVIVIFYCITAKSQRHNVSTRVSNVAIAFGNCTFIGLPLLEALLPDYPEAVVYSIVFFMSMSILGWTIASFVITRDKKYVSIKKIFFNPATIGLIIALPFFLTSVTLPSAFHGAVSLFGRMSTPICMLILGMRLATLSPKSVFADVSKYLTLAVRQLVVPMLYIVICLLLPIENNLKLTLVVCGSTPVAAVLLNYAELIGEGQEYSAGTIVLSNILSIATMPIMLIIASAILAI